LKATPTKKPSPASGLTRAGWAKPGKLGVFYQAADAADSGAVADAGTELASWSWARARSSDLRAEPALEPTQYPQTLVAMAAKVPSITFASASDPAGRVCERIMPSIRPKVSRTTVETTGAPHAIGLLTAARATVWLRAEAMSDSVDTRAA
jgi:hypothetical protein